MLPKIISSETIRGMYLEICSIAQALNIGLLAQVVVSSEFQSALEQDGWGIGLLALGTFLITIIFWIRYYFDTIIINRSFTLLPTLLFFVYALLQGLLINFITRPERWFIVAGLMMLMASLFYVSNLREISRKHEELNTRFTAPSDIAYYIGWQHQRRNDLILIGLVALVGAALYQWLPAFRMAQAVLVIGIASYQLYVCQAYTTLSNRTSNLPESAN